MATHENEPFLAPRHWSGWPDARDDDARFGAFGRDATFIETPWDRPTRPVRRGRRGSASGAGPAGCPLASAVGAALALAAAAAGAAVLWATGAGFEGVRAAGPEPALAAAAVRGTVGLVLVLTGFVCGSFVACRLTGGTGGRPGLAVWGWCAALVVALAGLSVFTGSFDEVLLHLGALVPMPSGTEESTVPGLIVVMTVGGVSLVGSVLGARAGARADRRAR